MKLSHLLLYLQDIQRNTKSDPIVTMADGADVAAPVHLKELNKVIITDLEEDDDEDEDRPWIETIENQCDVCHATYYPISILDSVCRNCRNQDVTMCFLCGEKEDLHWCTNTSCSEYKKHL